MAVASRGNSSLNPNAPLFVPLAYQQVEDFSAEWWKLVQTSPWFRDYWLRERYECFEDAECFADLFPDPIEDPEDADEFAELELQLEDVLLQDDVAGDDEELRPGFDSARQSSEEKEMEMDPMLWKSLNGKAQKPFSKPEVRCFEKAPRIVSVKVGPRRIQQPSNSGTFV